jgi:hypothetical protein
MDDAKLDMRLVTAWREAAEDLGIAVIAPAELADPAGRPFWCEAFVRDFGSPAGAVVLSERTERRVREQLRGGDFWYAVHRTRMRAAYARDLRRPARRLGVVRTGGCKAGLVAGRPVVGAALPEKPRLP